MSEPMRPETEDTRLECRAADGQVAWSLDTTTGTVLSGGRTWTIQELLDAAKERDAFVRELGGLSPRDALHVLKTLKARNWELDQLVCGGES